MLETQEEPEEWTDQELDRMHLDQLALAMNKSRWQSEKLDTIKGRALFKLCRHFLLAVEQYCCASMYALVSTARLEEECEHELACSGQNYDDERHADARSISTLPAYDPESYAGSQQSGQFCFMRRRTNNSLHSFGLAPWKQLEHVADPKLESHRRELDEARARCARECLEQRRELIRLNERTFGLNRHRGLFVKLSRLYLAYYIYSVVGLSVSTFFQYKFDFHNFHLDRYQRARVASELGYEGQQQQQILRVYARNNLTESSLMELRERARREASSVGSFLMEQTYFSESCYILMILVSLLVYLGPILYFRLVKGTYDFYPTRMLIDWDLEQLNCNYMIERAVKSVVKSSEVFTKISLAQARLLLRPRRTKERTALAITGRLRSQGHLQELLRRPPAAIRATGKRADDNSVTDFAEEKEASTRASEKLAQKERQYVDEHKWLERNLKRMALEGQLQPLDRCDADEIVISFLLQALYLLSTCPGCFVWNICLFGSLPTILDFAYDTSWASVVSMLNLACQNVALTVGGVHYFACCLVFCRSQVLFVDKLRRMIDEFLLLNRTVMMNRHGRNGGRQSGQLAPVRHQHHHNARPRSENSSGEIEMAADSPARTSNGPEYDLVNKQLLLLLMRYKIFVLQLKSARANFSYLLACAFGLMIIFPILARLHMPYVNGSGSKALIIIVSLVMLGLPDLAVTPIAWSNAHSIRLYHHLSSLLANLVEWESKLGHNERAFYNEHTLWLLRKELKFPETFRKQFAICALGMDFSYTELLKIHFWLGLLIITFFLDFQDEPGEGASPTLSPSGAGTLAAKGGGGVRGMHFGLFTGWLSDPLGIAGSYGR